jgi:membrane associated rhomboid family serine protease
MSRYDSTENARPLMHLGEYPLYSPHVIALVYTVSMIVTAFVGPNSFLYSHLAYINSLIWQGEVWRLFSYGLINMPSIDFAFDMVMLIWFGRDVEKFYGRKLFLILFACVYLLPPVLLATVSPLMHAVLAGKTGALAIFVAFATLYPGVVLWLNISAKVAAIILVGIYSLMAIATRNWGWLAAIWIGNGFAHVFVRYQRSEFTIPNPFAWLRRPKFKVLPGQGAEKPQATAPVTAHGLGDVDALLDKIAQSGIHSLTPEERARLDRSSAELMKRKGGAPRSR